MTIRPIHWPQEAEALRSLDTSFSTPSIFRVRCDGHAFTLGEEQVTPPIHKSFPLSVLSGALLPSDHTVLAENAGGVAGFASMRFETWNKRSILRHLDVAPEHRRKGVGRALVEAISSLSDSAGSRCLWVETQNINYPAIQFYLRLGFRLCGFDTSLYDLSSRPTQGIALFFARFANTPSPNHSMRRWLSFVR